jgi:hypothetical protein
MKWMMISTWGLERQSMTVEREHCNYPDRHRRRTIAPLHQH